MVCCALVGAGKKPTMPRERVLWTQWGEHARSILRQYNADCPNEFFEFRGPHYVVYTQGRFYLYPYGPMANYRRMFECRPEFLPGVEELLWTFMVMR